MKISYNWLREYVPADLPVDQLSDQLTMVGLEVDDVETIGSDFNGVVVGHVLDVRQHPDADRLVVCTVDTGDEEHLQIVCGAPNVAAGQAVPVATIGTRLTLPPKEDGGEPVSLKIKKGKLRGVVSQGMICAEDELGISDDHDGIMVLAGNTVPGTPFKTYIEESGALQSDAVFDIALTPNRPDAICHLGVARDIAAVNELPLSRPDISSVNIGSNPGISVSIEDEAACQRYVGIIVRDVTIKPSPDWLANRLRAIGLRPRNNVVDITNYVMHELGQPLHAFDLDTISDAHIRVHTTSSEQPFVTLDGKEHNLPVGTPMIADGERNVAIAGVMGGENSEVTDSTTNVLIESAYFDPPTVRRVAKALGMQTDASYRFERGVDPEGQLVAACRAADLMEELAGGTVDRDAVDQRAGVSQQRSIVVRPDRVRTITGADVDTDTMENILRRLEFVVTQEGEALECTVPSFRHDVEREIDVIEEIARIYGFDKIPEPAHIQLPTFVPRQRPADSIRDRVQSILTGNGYSEIYTNSLLSPTRAEAANDPVMLGEAYAGDVVATANAISSEMSAMRPSLLPGMLGVVAHNLNHGQDSVRVFEFGHVFRRGNHDNNVIPGYIEVETLCFSTTGTVPAAWNAAAHEANVFDIKGIVETILLEANLPGLREVPSYEPSKATDYRIDFYSGDRLIGTVGRVGSDLAAASDIEDAVYFAEINWTEFLSLSTKYGVQPYREISRFPQVSRDIAVIVADTLESGELQTTVKKSGGKLLRSSTVFDVYSGKGIDKGKKSLALNMVFAADRTLKDEEVDRLVDKIIKNLERQHGAILRQ